MSLFCFSVCPPSPTFVNGVERRLLHWCCIFNPIVAFPWFWTVRNGDFLFDDGGGYDDNENHGWGNKYSKRNHSKDYNNEENHDKKDQTKAPQKKDD